MQFTDDDRVEICLNLGHVRKSLDAAGCSLMLKIHYCALFVAEYVKHIERAKSSLPQNYFEGLVFLNALEVYKGKKASGICSPLSRWRKRPRHACRVRPIEISCAINALNKLRLFTPVELNEEERLAIRVFSEELLLYSGLPEIAYVGTKVPIYTVVDFIKTIGKIAADDPETRQEFPMLMLAPFEQIDHMTTHDLFLCCIQSDNTFLIGLAVRLIVFLQLQYDIKLENCSCEALVEEIKQYIDYSTVYYTEASRSNSYLIKDNLFAISIAVKAANNYLSACGEDVNSGNIHSIL